MEEWETPADSHPDLEYYEAIPYVLVVESVERGGQWLRRAEHPELPGCVAEAPSALEAVDLLDRERKQLLRALWDRGGTIPVPRPPLRVSSARRREVPDVHGQSDSSDDSAARDAGAPASPKPER